MAVLMNFTDDWREGYVTLCKTVEECGTRKGSRNGDVAEVRDFMFTLAPEAIDLPLGVGRRLSTSLAAAEAIQLCAGVAMPELTEAASAQVATYVRDPDGTVHGNYGGRVGLQIMDVVQKLIADCDSRQAVISIWDRALDSRHRLPMPKDIPCTLSIVFGISPRSELTMSVTMRSSDVWLGIPYDVFQFRQLQRTVARLLGVSIGEYTHHSVSMHVYVKDLEGVKNLAVDQEFFDLPRFLGEIGPMPEGLCASRAKDLPEVMRNVLTGHDLHYSSHEWYHRQLGAAYASTLG